MRLSWMLGNDERVIFEHQPMEIERLKMLVNLVKFSIAGMVAITAIVSTGGWGVLAVGFIGFFMVVVKV